jgi:hypothetical protein
MLAHPCAPLARKEKCPCAALARKVVKMVRKGVFLKVLFLRFKHFQDVKYVFLYRFDTGRKGILLGGSIKRLRDCAQAGKNLHAQESLAHTACAENFKKCGALCGVELFWSYCCHYYDYHKI